MSDWVRYRDRPHRGPGRPYSAVRPNRYEQMALAVAREPGFPAPYYAARVGVHVHYAYTLLTDLALRGLVAARWERSAFRGHTRERRLWTPTALVRDLLDGRDDPSTPLGQLRALVAARPRSAQELAQAMGQPLDAMRTLLRLLVLQGDLERRRGPEAERYHLPACLDDDDTDDATAVAA